MNQWIRRAYLILIQIQLQTTVAISFGLLPETSLGSIQLPRALNKSDRIEALRIVGLSASSKILSDPYPMGGYAGFEVGISLESFPTEDLSRIGSGITPPQQQSSISKLTIGKGLYENIDLFMQFTPYTRQDSISQFGGVLRWSFYQASYLPLSLGAVAHLNNISVNNELTAYTRGLDLIGGVNVENLAIYAGVGATEATGVFLGGETGLSSSGEQESEYASGLHTVIGGNIKLANVFVTLQIDRYPLPVYSGKIGLRF